MSPKFNCELPNRKLRKPERSIKSVLCATVLILKMKFLVLLTILLLSNADESVDTQKQLNLFQKATGLNRTEAQIIWREVEKGILSDLTSRSTQSNPKFRLELTDVSLVIEKVFGSLEFKRTSTGAINPIRWNKEVIKQGVVYNSGVVIIEKPGYYYVSIGARDRYDVARLTIGIRLNNIRIVAADK